MPEDMVPVASSCVESVGYDENDHELHVRFTSGSEYVYKDVPRIMFDSLLTAPSKGRFINGIKGIYPCEKV